ncbi:MAG TPA: F0F1 ATP synthase subunit delta [Phenylobacterium sp.]|uniref:ATP synthase subunit delta n=1 Tax=Phenylobacterium conjunctum TaxID=1298959 RepID=A0ABW3T704_9CAUL|nr:F0F1 ATP synthase subunit delta [Phenylobacterium sp.]
MADDSKTSNVGDRYAQALFDLATEEKTVAAVAADLQSLKKMSAESQDFRVLLASPAFSAEDKGKALAALAAKAKFHATTQKFLGLIAANGRVSALPAVIVGFEALAAKARGAVAAQVVTALPLTAAQTKGVAQALRTALGADPEITTRVDPSLLGGIKVQVGSRLFDASLRSKLDSLKFALKRA